MQELARITKDNLDAIKQLNSNLSDGTDHAVDTEPQTKTKADEGSM
jgi:hypothetical protein